MKTVYIFVSHYIPGFKAGGPIQSVKNITTNLSKEYNFNIITSDRDIGDKLPFNGVEHGKWNLVGNAKVFYVKRFEYLSLILNGLLAGNTAPTYYFNSFFCLRFTIIPLFFLMFRGNQGVRLVLAPRGEFSEGAIRLKRGKKSIFLFLFKISKLQKRIIWHATSQHESNDIARVMGESVHIQLAKNIPNTPRINNLKISPSEINSLRIIYVSRIVEKKNLLFAIETLARVSAKICFSIFGPIEDLTYWEKCKAKMRSLPQNIETKYLGVLPQEEVSKRMNENDLLFLPTFGENYGHVIVEALSVGIPVMISDQTPWRDLEKHGCGISASLTSIDQFIRYIEYYSKTSVKEKEMHQRSALAYAQKQFFVPEINQEYVNLFK